MAAMALVVGGVDLDVVLDAVIVARHQCDVDDDDDKDGALEVECTSSWTCCGTDGSSERALLWTLGGVVHRHDERLAPHLLPEVTCGAPRRVFQPPLDGLKLSTITLTNRFMPRSSPHPRDRGSPRGEVVANRCASAWSHPSSEHDHVPVVRRRHHAECAHDRAEVVE